MDYFFYIDSFTQLPRASVEDEHSAIGHFLSEELNQDCEQLQLIIRKLHRDGENWQYVGREWLIQVETDAVTVCHHSQLQTDDSELPDELLNTDNPEYSATCGREDFLHLTEAWMTYLLKS